MLTFEQLRNVEQSGIDSDIKRFGHSVALHLAINKLKFGRDLLLHRQARGRQFKYTFDRSYRRNYVIGHVVLRQFIRECKGRYEPDSGSILPVLMKEGFK